MKTTQLSKFENIPADYARLLTMFMPKAIHDEVDYENTVEVIDIMAGHDLNDDQELYLDTLSTLVEAYEESHHEVKSRRLTPLDALEFPDGRTRDERADRERFWVSVRWDRKSCARQRKLGVTYAKILAKHFAVDIGLFVD